MEATLKKWASRDNQYIRIDGATPPAERTGMVSLFEVVKDMADDAMMTQSRMTQSGQR